MKKRAFDIAGSLFGLAVLWPFMVVLTVAASFDTRSFGLFRQTRVGRAGKEFTLFKIRTMRVDHGDLSTVTVTVKGDNRITALGAVLRRFKLDELPQLVNVLLGDMSFVGPRPDVAGFADRLEGTDRAMLRMRPGITGLASLVFRDEEEFLASYANPVEASHELVWPTKVRINLAYERESTLVSDLKCIKATILPTEGSVDQLLGDIDESLLDDQVIKSALRRSME